MEGEERLSVEISQLELWTEVLARLSVKDLIRFRCVSKFWLSLIDSQHFNSKHLHLCKSNHDKLHFVSVNRLGHGFINKYLSLTRYDAYKLNDYEEIIRLPLKRYFVQVKGYVNGLVLLIRTMHGRDYLSQGELLLWNPLIRKALILPSYPVNQSSKVLLGFDPSSNDYKVAVFGDIKSQAGEAAIYKLSTGSWHSTIINYIKGVDVQHKTAVFSKGASHSLAADNRPEYHTTIEKVLRITLVASFDFDLETFRYRDLPCKVGNFGAPVQGVLFVIEDSLALFQISHTEFCIWLMQEHDGNELWTKWYTGGPCFDMYNILRKSVFPRIIHAEKSMALLVIRENEVSVFDVLSCERDMLLPRTYDFGVELMDVYVESLVLLSHKHGRSDTDIFLSYKQCKE